MLSNIFLTRFCCYRKEPRTRVSLHNIRHKFRNTLYSLME
nr:MAG TPA: hypothetical protein [Caudoviricetes sp.]